MPTLKGPVEEESAKETQKVGQKAEEWHITKLREENISSK